MCGLVSNSSKERSRCLATFCYWESLLCCWCICWRRFCGRRGFEMTANGWFQIGLYLLLLLAITKPLGVYMARVFSGEKTFMDPMLRPVERLLYRVTGVDETHEMRWTEYATAMLLLSVVSMILLYIILRVQQWLPWNPQHFGAVAPDLAFNTAASFTTNTNWQVYSGESAMSYFTQMAGLAYHNFLSAATGIALAIAVIRGIARKEMQTLGNFWVDLTRTILWVLLPACIVVALFLVSQGTVQSLKPYVTAKLVDPQTVQVRGKDGKPTTQHVNEQSITLGPVASQEAIKMYGTNGGGFFNANSAHPFENPTPLTNFAQMLLIFAIGSGLTYTLGRMTGSQKHGWAVWGAMAPLFIAGVFFAYRAEARGNPELHGLDQHVSAMQPGGNMEGKEVRFGIADSALFATITTDASCGAVNGVHDAFTPLGGKIAMLAVLIFSLLILTFTAVGSVTADGKAGITHPGPHGMSQILYAYTSGAANNGSAFAGLSANTLWYNVTIAFDMLFGRFFMVLPVLAIAGNLAKKKIAPETAGTFPVTTPLFATLLVSVILIVGALTFFPALSLGPILEHLLLHAGKVFGG